jgi:hypothetical protein
MLKIDLRRKAETDPLRITTTMTEPYQGINTIAEGPIDGLQELKQLLFSHTYALNVPGPYKPTVNN